MAGRRRPAVGLRPHVVALRGEAVTLFPAAGVFTQRPTCSLSWHTPILLLKDVQDGAQSAVCRAEEQHAHIDALVNPVGISVLDALPVVDHENAGAAPVQKMPVEWIEALAARRVQPLEEKALPPFVEVERGGVQLRRLRPASGPGAACEKQVARAAEPRRQRGIGGGIASDSRLAVLVQGMAVV